MAYISWELQKSGRSKYRQTTATTVFMERSPMGAKRSELLTGNGGVVERESDSSRPMENDDVEEEANLANLKGSSMGQAPRCEAFLMTGDKILRLNSKISRKCAQIKESELPKHMEVLDSPPTPAPFSDLENAGDSFGGQQHIKSKRRRPNQEDQHGFPPMPPSQSENGLSSTPSSSTAATAASKMTTVANEQQQHNPSIIERLENGCQEPSLVTVHGFHNAYKKTSNSGTKVGSLNTDICGGESQSTIQSTDLMAHGATGPDMPSPTSPSYYSEPVSPARFAFVGGVMVGSESPISKKSQEHYRMQRQNGDASPSSVIRAQQHLHCRMDDSSPRESPRHVNGNTSIINVSQQLISTQPTPTAPTSVIVTGGTSSDSESPGGSVHSTPLKERIQRFEAASRSSSPSTTANELDAETARRLAKRLYTLEGFRRSDVAKHLVKNNEFSNLVAIEYLKLFNLAGLRIDAALREFLHHFTLTGETSERGKVISYFSKHYYDCNPGLFSFEDDVHMLTCAVLLLNTDLHSQTISKKISCHDFIENISQAGYSFPRDLLKALYQSIKSHPMHGGRSESEMNASGISGTCDGRFIEMLDPDSQVEYKKGWVLWKCVIDEDGKLMPFDRRNWKMFYATLKGMVGVVFAQGYVTYSLLLKIRLDDQQERAAWMETSMTSATSEAMTDMEEIGVNSGCLGVGTNGRFSAQSG